jgi:hypothetical protein
MILHRVEFTTKRGCVQDALALLKTASNRPGSLHVRQRICTRCIGRFDTIILEIEFSSLADLEVSWAAWFASPEGAEFNKKWFELTEPGATDQVWTISEW